MPWPIVFGGQLAICDKDFGQTADDQRMSIGIIICNQCAVVSDGPTRDTVEQLMRRARTTICRCVIVIVVAIVVVNVNVNVDGYVGVE